MTQLISSDGLLTEISDIVAEASMQLPSLVHTYDAEFLKRQTNKAVSLFISHYMAGASAEERSALKEAQNANDLMDAGILLHKSLATEDAEKGARTVFDVTREEMHTSIVDDYNAFVLNLASQKNS